MIAFPTFVLLQLQLELTHDQQLTIDILAQHLLVLILSHSSWPSLVLFHIKLVGIWMLPHDRLSSGLAAERLKEALGSLVSFLEISYDCLDSMLKTIIVLKDELTPLPIASDQDRCQVQPLGYDHHPAQSFCHGTFGWMCPFVWDIRTSPTLYHFCFCDYSWNDMCFQTDTNRIRLYQSLSFTVDFQRFRKSFNRPRVKSPNQWCLCWQKRCILFWPRFGRGGVLEDVQRRIVIQLGLVILTSSKASAFDFFAWWWSFTLYGNSIGVRAIRTLSPNVIRSLDMPLSAIWMNSDFRMKEPAISSYDRFAFIKITLQLIWVTWLEQVIFD